MGFAYVWEYEVDPAHLGDFERLYGPSGDGWSCPGSRLGTTAPSCIGIGRTRIGTSPSTTGSRPGHGRNGGPLVEERFEELDRRGQELTLSERELGRFDLRGDG